MYNIRSLRVTILSVFLLSSCGSLTESDKPATRTWWLEPYTASTITTSDDVELVKLSISVVPGLDTDRILSLSGDAELTPYTAARWADDLPELLKSLIRRTLRNSKSYKVIDRSAEDGRQACVLTLEVTEFYADLVSTPAARLAMEGRYQCLGDKARALRLTASAPVSGNDMSDVVKAFQIALDGVMADLLTFLQG